MTQSALVHDFFVVPGGAESCAIELSRLLPGAEVHTSFFHRGRFGSEIDPARVRTWPFQQILGATPRFRSLLPLYPAWFSMLDLRKADLVVSSSVAFTHAVRTRQDALHISYVHTPMRYAWDLDTYLGGSSLGLPSRTAARLIRPILQRWDRSTASRPNVIVANSETVRDRIQRLWNRSSEVIYPPVDTAQIPMSQSDEGFLLVAARMLAYRRIDIAVEAATMLGRELVVVGDGPERARLESIAGPDVRFLGRVDRPALLDLFARCRAYLVPGVEDFGIAPVEAMAAGKPVVAFRAGGATETVLDGVTGTFFELPTAASLCEAIERLEGMTLDSRMIRSRAEGFDTGIFRRRWLDLLARLGVDPSLYASGT